MHIAVIHSQYHDLAPEIVTVNPKGPQQTHDTVENIKSALESHGHKVTVIEADNHLLVHVDELEDVDLLFNLSAGVSGKRTQANVVGMLEMSGIPMVGSPLASHIVGLHKEITKSVLFAHQIPTSRFQLVSSEEDTIRDDFNYPLMVKPEHEGSGIGITASSIVESPEQLHHVIKEKIALHQQVLLVEEFLPGREFTVGIIGNQSLEILPIKETSFPKDGPQILTNELKGNGQAISTIPAPLTLELEEEITRIVKKTYRVIRCRDFARIDLRLDKNGQPHVIEINTFPGLGKDFSYFPLVASAAGYSYEDLINRLVTVAMEERAFS